MNPDMQKELLARLDAFAVKLGTTAQQLWGVLLLQSKIEGYTALAWAFVSLVILVCIKFKWGWAWELATREHYNDNPAPAILLATAAVVFFIVFCINANEAVADLFNPGYFALQHILAAVK